jgi:hypothetical protein
MTILAPCSVQWHFPRQSFVRPDILHPSRITATENAVAAADRLKFKEPASSILEDAGSFMK